MRPNYTPEVQQLFERAMEYDRTGDVYNAVKLYKRVMKLAPEWDKPYYHLSIIYKYRNEWKPSLHYSQKAIEINPTEEDAWWNLAIAATALKKWQAASDAWNQLGYDVHDQKIRAETELQMIALRINRQQPEIVWARSLDPARARIESIPHPSSGRRYAEVVLHDGKQQGWYVADGKQFPVFDELQQVESSKYHTYAVLLDTPQRDAAETLGQLCYNEDLGFENWSNLTRLHIPENTNRLPEYYSTSFSTKEASEVQLVAIAALNVRAVRRILQTWRVITLHEYGQIQRLL